MTVLVPLDGSENSFRALSFAADVAARLDADLHLLHVTDAGDDMADELRERAAETLADTAFDAEVEVLAEGRRFRPHEGVGKLVVDLVAEEGYDHVVMGHHGGGIVGRAILGSATETVMDEAGVPLTVVP